MRRNSGIIGPKTLTSDDSASGAFESFDVYNARLGNEWPREVEASIVPRETTIYRGGQGYFVDWTLSNLPEDHTKHWRIVNKTNFSQRYNSVSQIWYESRGITYPQPTSETLQGDDLTGEFGSFYYSARYLRSDAADYTVTFQVELYSKDPDDNITVHAITPVISIAPTTLTMPEANQDLNEGSSLTLTFTIEGVGGLFNNQFQIFYDDDNTELNYPRSGSLSYSILSGGTYNSTTKTLTKTLTLTWAKDYHTYTPSYNYATIRFKPQSLSFSSTLLGFEEDVQVDLVKTTSSPTFYSPTGTLYEGTQYRYGVDFGETPVGNFTYYISSTSSSDWTDGTISGNLSKSGNRAYVNKTWSRPNDTFNDTFTFEVSNSIGNTIASQSFTMNNITPSISSWSLDQLGAGGGPISNYQVDETGANVTYRLSFYGSKFSGKSFTYALSPYSSGPADGTNPISAEDFVSGTLTGNAIISNDTYGYFDFQLAADEELEGIEYFSTNVLWNGNGFPGSSSAPPILVNDTSRPPPPPNDFDIETAGDLNNISANNVSSYPKLWDRDEEWAYACYAGQTTYAGASVIKFYMINNQFDTNDMYVFYYDLSTGVLYNPNEQVDWDTSNWRCVSFNRTGTHYVYADNSQRRVVIYQAATPWTIDRYGSDQQTDDFNNSLYNESANIYRDVNGNVITYGTMYYTHVAFSDDDSTILISAYMSGTVYYWKLDANNGYRPASYNFGQAPPGESETPNANGSRNVSNITYSTSYEYTIWGRFEFNRDGTEVTLYDVDSHYSSSGGPFLEKYILTTPFDMGTKPTNPAARLNVKPPDDFNRQLSYPSFWFVNQFFFDRVSEDRLYVLGSPSSSYYYMWDYEISTILRLESRPGYDISTAEFLHSSSSDVNYNYNVRRDFSGASYYDDNTLLYWNYSQQRWYTLDFSSNYNNPSENYEINISSWTNSTSYQQLTWASRGSSYAWGAGQIAYTQDNSNEYIAFRQGVNYQVYGSLQGSNTNIDWTNNNPSTDIHYYYPDGNTGTFVISYMDGSYNHSFRGYDITSDAENPPSRWMVPNNNYSWQGSRSTGLYQAKDFGRFEFNKDGTQVTLKSLIASNTLETYDLSSDPFNISLATQSGASPIKTKSFPPGEIGPYEIIDFVFERKAPKTRLYLIATQSNSNYFKRLTYEMDAEYINNVGNTWDSGAETLDPYIVEYSGSTVEITFIDSDDAANFKTFMDDFLTISGAYSMYVHAQGTATRFFISDGSGRSASVTDSTVIIDFNNGVTNVTAADDTYGLNTIRFLMDVAVVTGDTSTNTASIGMASGNAAAIADAFSNSTLGFSDFYGYGAIGYLFIDNTSALAAEVVAVNDTLGFAWDTNLSANTGFSNPSEYISFTVDKAITGTGSATVVEAAALTKILVSNFFTDGQNYFDMQFSDPATKSRALEIFRGWGQNYTNWNPTLWMVTSTDEAFWSPRFGNGSSIQDYNETSFGVTSPAVNSSGPNPGIPPWWRILIDPNLQSVPSDPWAGSGAAYDNNNIAVADYQAPNFYIAYASNDSRALFDKPTKYMTTLEVGDGFNRFRHTSIENVAYDGQIPQYGGLTWNASAQYIGGGAASFDITEMKYDPTALSFPVAVEFQYEINSSFHGFELSDPSIRQSVIDDLNASAGTVQEYEIIAYDQSWSEGRYLRFVVGTSGAFAFGGGGGVEMEIGRLVYGWEPNAPGSFGGGTLNKL